MAETLVSLALEKVTDLVVNEAVFLFGVRDEVERLKDELQRMESFLKVAAEHKQDQNQLDRTLVGQVRHVAFQAEDVIDSFVSQLAQRGGFHGILNKFTMPLHLYKIGGQVQQIRTRLERLSKTLPTYKAISQGYGSNVPQPQQQQQQQQQQLRRIYSHIEEDEDVVSLEGITTNVLAQLMTVEEDQDHRRRPHVVVSIVGMGGIGKTTLAKKVYNHIGVNRYFDSVAWAFISQQCSPRDVFHGVLIKVASPSKQEREEIDKLTEDELIGRLYDILKQKRYLVVLDDIWKRNDWDSLKHAFPPGRNGSKILFTTRDKNVALYADPYNSPIELPLLTDKESWKLFSRKANLRDNMESQAYTKQFEKLGRDMVKQCGGLPLAVVVLGRLLATKRTLAQWEVVHRNIHGHINKFHHEDDHYGTVNQILGLSYDDLPFSLKQCFLYLCHYPEDWEFSKREVIRLWIAEGFIPCTSGASTMEDVAEGYLEDLIGRYLVQVDKMDYTGEGVKTCRLHDLLREMCLLNAAEEGFLESFRMEGNVNSGYCLSATTSNSTTSSNEARRIAVHLSQRDIVNKHHFNMPVPLDRDYSNIRSFLLCSDGIVVRSDIPKRDKFRLLRVLKLETKYGFPYEEKVWHVPSEIGKLVHLRYLGLQYKKLVLPRSIANLKSLYTLKVRTYYPLTVPDVLYKLENVRHLLLFYDGSLRLDTLKNIETLKTITARSLIQGRRTMPNLTNIRSLGIIFESAEEVEAILVNSRILYHLCSLKMGLKYDSTFPDLTPLGRECDRLFKLRLDGKVEDVQSSPHVLKFLPETIVELHLSRCELKYDPMGVLEKLPHLRILSMKYRTYIGTKMVCSAYGFPQLLEIDIALLSSLEEWQIAEGAMPRLNRLTMNACHRMNMLPEGLKYLTTLHQLQLRGMKRSLVERIQLINGVQGEDLYKVRHIPSIHITSRMSYWKE